MQRTFKNGVYAVYFISDEQCACSAVHDVLQTNLKVGGIPVV